MKSKILFALGMMFVVASSPSAAREIKIMSPVALERLLTKVAGEIEKVSGDKIVFIWSESGKIKSEIEAGVAFDIAILTPNLVDELMKNGKLDSSSRTPIARGGIGVAVRKGAPKPDVSTVEAFKAALLNAKSIGFVEQSATSRYLATLFDRLGIANAVKDKLKPLPGTAAQFVAKGDVEVALTQIATILPYDGVEYAGPLPQEIQLYTVFTAAASPASKSEGVRDFLKALASPSNAAVLKASGLEPAN